MNRKIKNAGGIPPAAATKDPNRYPEGLNRRKVQAIIDHYENQTEEQAAAEDEAAYHSNAVTMLAVPVKLVPEVQKLIARRIRVNRLGFACRSPSVCSTLLGSAAFRFQSVFGVANAARRGQRTHAQNLKAVTTLAPIELKARTAHRCAPRPVSFSSPSPLSARKPTASAK